jgi:hypothetical protein
VRNSRDVCVAHNGFLAFLDLDQAARRCPSICRDLFDLKKLAPRVHATKIGIAPRSAYVPKFATPTYGQAERSI